MNFNNIKIKFLNEIDSTNDYLKINIKDKKIIDDYLVITNKQTNGRGANGRNFFSDENGVYFSLAIFNKNFFNITPKVAVSVYLAIKNTFNIELEIKWINDLYYKNKKVVGILCERLLNENCIIIGIGIDLYKNNSLSKDMENIIGYIFDKKIDENTLIRNIVDNIYNLLDSQIPDIYIKKNRILNKDFFYKGKKFLAINIDKNGNLIGRDEFGFENVFFSSKDIIFNVTN